MTGKIEIINKYDVNTVLTNPNKIYVFGDNLKGCGKAGQAIIRDCPNTIGIPTKREPSMNSSSFFSDKEDEYIAVFSVLALIKEKLRENKIIVMPLNGIGTGYAQMYKKSPKLYKKMVSYIQELEPNYLNNLGDDKYAVVVSTFMAGLYVDSTYPTKQQAKNKSTELSNLGDFFTSFDVEKISNLSKDLEKDLE